MLGPSIVARAVSCVCVFAVWRLRLPPRARTRPPALRLARRFSVTCGLTWPSLLAVEPRWHVRDLVTVEL